MKSSAANWSLLGPPVYPLESSTNENIYFELDRKYRAIRFVEMIVCVLSGFPRPFDFDASLPNWMFVEEERYYYVLDEISLTRDRELEESLAVEVLVRPAPLESQARL